MGAALSYPANNQMQMDRRPVSPKTGTIGVMTSGTTYNNPIPNKIIINMTTATSITFTMADGTTVNIGTPASTGLFQFDIQAIAVTLGTAADGVITGFYDIPGG